MPACLFCGQSALAEFEPEGVEPPEGWLPFQVDAAAAGEAFRKFAKSSFWYPSDLRRARLELKQLLLPAWAWSGELETHWTGLVAASSPSGKRPTGGADRVRFEQILVPASQSLRQAELTALGAYDESGLKGFEDSEPDTPRELSEVTRSTARARAQDEMARRRREQLAKEHGASNLRVASVILDLAGRPVLVPVWIGAYRYGDKVFRVLVNGQSGAFHGEAPISWWRVAAVVLVIASIVGAFALMVSVCGGAAAIVR